MRTGDFADAKGEGYALLLSLPFRRQVLNQIVDVTTRHLRAARARGAGLKVYFAEKGAADLVRKEFKKRDLGDVVVGLLPPSRPR